MTWNNIQPVRYLAICSAVGLVIASAGFGAVYAYRVGIQHSILLAGLSVLMALGLEGCKPLAIAYALKAKTFAAGLLLASLGLVAVAYSLTSELSLMASTRGDLVATREADSLAARETVGARQRIDAELRSLGIQRPSEAIQAELNPLLTDKRLQNCQGWLANYRLREICIDKVSPLQAELAKAERREKLEADLSKEPDHQGGLHVSSGDPGSIALVTYLAALGLRLPTEIVAQWLILVPVLALELGSAMGLVLVQATGAIIDTTTTTTVAPMDRPRAHKTKAQEKAAQKIVNQLRFLGGSTAVTERSLAKSLGSSRPSIRRAIAELELSGALTRVPSRTGTQLCLRSS